jgi:hypothetical protein
MGELRIMATIEWLYDNYKSRFPDGRPDQFLNLMKRNFPKQYNQAKQYIERMAKQIEEVVERTTEQPKQSTKKVSTSNTNINKDLDILYGNQDNKPKLDDIKQKVGGATKSAPKATPKAGGVLKGVGGKVAPAAGIALELPSYWNNVTDENADWMSRSLDTLGLLTKGGSIIAGATGVGLLPAVAGYTGGAGLQKAAGDIRSRNATDKLLAKDSLKPLTPEEQQRYNQYIINNQDKMIAQTKQQMKDLDGIRKFYEGAEQRLTATENMLDTPETPQSILSGVNFNGNVNTPKTQSGASGNISNNVPVQQNNTVDKIMANNINRNNTLLNDIVGISNVIKGAQAGYQQPNVGVTQDEVNAYLNALEQAGQNLTRQNQFIQDYRNAVAADDRALRQAQFNDALQDVTNELQMPSQVSWVSPEGQLRTINVETNASPANNVANLKAQPTNVERLAKDYQLTSNLAAAQNETLQKRAELASAMRLSQETGLPLNIAANMSGSDYVNYLKPIQETQQKLTTQGTQGIIDLIKQERNNIATAERENAKAIADLTTEQYKQLNENQRATLDNWMDYKIAQIDNATKLDVARQLGVNSQDLEKLKQSDPLAAMKIEAATYYNDPIGQTMLKDVYAQLYPEQQTEQNPTGMTRDQLDYWRQFK